MSAIAVRHGDADGLSVDPFGRTVLEPAEPDLGALQIRQDAHRTPGFVRCLAHAGVGSLVVGIVAMAEVHSGDVHSGLDQGFHHGVGVGGRAESTNDFAAPRHDA